MSVLPKIDVPTYEMVLPLSNKKIRYRPFLVKEEKLLLMAMEADDESSIMDAIKQIITNCVLEDFDAENLPASDLEFLFLNLRARSVGDVVELQYKCNNTLHTEAGNEHQCGNLVKFNVNLLEIYPEKANEELKKIQINSSTGIMMKYPTLKSYEVASNSTEVDAVMSVLLDCIDFIYDADNVYYSKDIPRKELQEFVEGLTRDTFKKIETFISSVPKIKKELNFKCNKCGYQENIMVEGLSNFFV